MNHKTIFFISIVILFSNSLCLAAQDNLNNVYVSFLVGVNYIKSTDDLKNAPLSTKPAYEVGVALGYSHIFWGIRPEIELSVLSNEGIGKKLKYLTIGSGMLNFIVDIPHKTTKLGAPTGAVPYIGLGIGESKCSKGNPACTGRVSQFILGIRSHLDSFLSIVIDARYRVLKKTDTISLNFGFIQEY